MNLTIDGVAQRAVASMVTGNYFDVLGVRPLTGRLLSEADDRLSPGVSREQAEAELQPLYLAALEEDVAAMGARRPSGEGWRRGRVRLDDGHRETSALRRDLSTPLVAVMAMTVVLLVIACANIAGLQIARASARVKEIGIRLAIGGSRTRVVRQLLTESLLIAGLGGLAAVAVALGTIRVLVGEMGDAATRIQLATTFVDARVLAFTLSLAAGTTVLVGLAPALLATRPAVWPALTAGIAADSRGGLRLRRILVTTQIALSLVLVTAAGLFGRTVYNLLHADAGFRTDRLVQFQLNPGAAGYDRQRAESAFRHVLESIQSLPGVDSATLAVAPALDNALIGFGLDVEGYSTRDNRARAAANAVAPGYFRMVGTPLVRGRDFSDADTARSRRVAIVSEAFVDRYLATVDPIGRTITFDYGGPDRLQHEIVGVAKDARFNNLRDAPPPTFYLPYTQFDVLNTSFFLVRAAGDPSLLRRPIEELVRQGHPDLPITGYIALDDQIDRLLRPERLVASLSLAFGLLATGLGAIGLYGVMAFSVARRTREIGLRMALGADRGAVHRMVLRGAAGMAAIGICLGAVFALTLSRYVESQLYGVRSGDLATIAGAAGVLAAVVLASGWLPARRACRVDPMLALRHE